MIIYNQQLAGYLMFNKFILQGMEKDKRNERFNVFHFKESDELNKKIEEYKSNK